MKKIVLVLALICLASCKKESNNVVLSKDEYNRLISEHKNDYPKPFTLDDRNIESGEDGIILGSDNHEYLVLVYNYDKMKILHYVECPKCINKQNDFENRIISEIIKLKDTIK